MVFPDPGTNPDEAEHLSEKEEQFDIVLVLVLKLMGMRSEGLAGAKSDFLLGELLWLLRLVTRAKGAS